MNDLLSTANALGHAIVPAADHQCMSAREVASYLRVNRKTVYEYAARNVIPCRRLGRRLVFSRLVIMAWLANQIAPIAIGE